jgi:hypothetical protein
VLVLQLKFQMRTAIYLAGFAPRLSEFRSSILQFICSAVRGAGGFCFNRFLSQPKRPLTTKTTQIKRIRMRRADATLYPNAHGLLLRIALVLLLLNNNGDQSSAATVAAARRLPFTVSARSAALIRSRSPLPSRIPGRISAPLSVGIQSALHHQPAVTSILVPKARAYQGALPLPIHYWHNKFVQKITTNILPSTTDQNPSEKISRGQRMSIVSMPATSVNIMRTRLIDGIKSTINSLGVGTSSKSPSLRNASAKPDRSLSFWDSMICGAVSRSVSQTLTHPANSMKTILQSDQTASIQSLMQRKKFRRLTQGAGAQLVLSLPQGAVNFAVLEATRKVLGDLARKVKLLPPDDGSNPANDVVAACLDFVSSAASTVCCIVVTGPITVIGDNIMSGNFNSLPAAVSGIKARAGIEGFYAGWRPQLVAKVPSYAATWVFFQRLKALHNAFFDRPLTNAENLAIGSLASGATVCIFAPLDTIKTRLVTQAARKEAAAAAAPYLGLHDAAVRMIREEGPASLYRGLSPRLASVVPMVAIQFAVYEAMKKHILEHKPASVGASKDKPSR